MPAEQVANNFITVAILLFIVLWIYAKKKGMTLPEVIKEIVSIFRRDNDG